MKKRTPDWGVMFSPHPPLDPPGSILLAELDYSKKRGKNMASLIIFTISLLTPIICIATAILIGFITT